jgi:hypothetical protein
VELQSIKRHFTQHFVNKARICIHKQTHTIDKRWQCVDNFLDEPEVFLKKLSGAVDQLVDDKWWIDSDKIKKKLDNET